MRLPVLLPALLLAAATLPPVRAQGTPPQAVPATPAPGARAEVKTALGVAALEPTGAATTFKVAPGTRIHAWAKVSGVQAGGTVDLVFLKGGRERFRHKLDIRRDPYRTYAYRTFRAGDAGAWTAKVLAADGQELGSADFVVTLD